MVYYFTSGNIKMIRSLVGDYEVTSEITPQEFMKIYLQRCPEYIDDPKIFWIVETFLGLQKHKEFLRDITDHMSKDLSEDEQQYIKIILYAVIFQITFKYTQSLYKCLFNLSKHLLNIFSNFLSDSEAQNILYQVAEPYYDTNFITEKIVAPICKWQPYISEMAFKYAEYVKKNESRKTKLPTVPTQPNVLNRKGKGIILPSILSPIPETPPNSVCNKGKKMLSKSAIDKKLKNTHEKNKQKALQLLNKVKNEGSHYAQGKSDNYYQTIFKIKNEMEHEQTGSLVKPKRISSEFLPPVEIKETATTLKRMNKRIQLTEHQETQWLLDLVDNCQNYSTNIEELEEYDRQEKERQRLINIEKKHLVGQISFEEAVLAKKKVQENNRKKYEEFLHEKHTWESEIENWKKKFMDKNRKVIESLALLELNVLQSKNNVMLKKKEEAENVKRETEQIIAKAMKKKQEELERRINMIKEIKILAIIAKKAKLPKMIDLTESSGLGLLCEMSMAELQERLSIMKINLKEELDKKKRRIKEENIAAKQKLDETRETIKTYFADRLPTNDRSKNGKTVINTDTKEVTDLRKLLEEKRKLRLQITT